MEIKKIGIIFTICLLIASVAPAKEEPLPGKFLFYCDLYEGFDNNVNLDSNRKHDLFTEVDAQIGYKKPFDGIFNATVNYYLNSITYHEVTDASFYDNNIALDLGANIFDGNAKLTWVNAVGYNYYPHEELSTYLLYSPQLSIKHKLTEAISQKIAYDFQLKGYPDRKATDGAGLPKESDRIDIRNGVTHELSGSFFNDVFLRLKNQYYVNDSNDQFMDFYDYRSYRANLTAIMPLLTKKLYGLLTVGYQRRDYNNRQLVNDNSKTEADDTYNAGSSLIFDITKTISVSLNYDYIQNESNEPSEEYSGSTMSCGFHYAF